MCIEALKSAFMDLSPDAIVLCRLGTDSADIVYVNDAFCTQFGYARDAIVGTSLDRLHDSAEWQALTADAKARSGSSRVHKANRHVQVSCPDLKMAHASVSAFIAQDEDADHLCLTYVGVSLTKAARPPNAQNPDASERDAEGMLSRLTSALDACPEPFAMFDAQDRLQISNAAFVLALTDVPDDITTGMTRDAVLNVGLKNGRFPFSDADVQGRVEDGDRSGAGRLEKAAPECDLTQAERTAHGDRVVYRLKTKEFVAAQDAADRAHARLISALDAYPDPIVIFDPDQRLVSWNRNYAASISDDPNDLKEGMRLKEVLMLAAYNGRYPDAVGQEEAWVDRLLAKDRIEREWEDLELDGDVHHRLLRSRSAFNDYVVIRINVTELVRQKRAAEAAQQRLIAALNAYPAPFVIYDAQDCLVVWNRAYQDSMTDDPKSLYVGMHRTDVARNAIRAGKIVEAIGREEEWMSDDHQENAVSQASQDLELQGDIHHRLLRSRADNGDLVILRIDITETVRQRRAQQATQDRLMSAINAFPDPFSIYDSDLNLVVWNPAYANSMTDKPETLKPGISLGELLLGAAISGKIPVAKGQEQAWVEEYYTSDMLKLGVEDFEFAGDQHYRIVRSRAKNGEYVVLRLNITEVVRQRRAVEQYAKKLEVANHEITHKALHDELTGLGNRRYLTEKFEELVALREVHGGEIAALHIDLDRFKQINDTMGHAAGDTVLSEVSKRLQKHTTTGDILARIGGDEFVMLLYVAQGSERPEQLGDLLLRDLSKPCLFDGKECRFGASIGLARTPLAQVDELLTNSDVALYKAKRSGRGQLGIFDRSDLEEMHFHKTLADQILIGIEAGEFVPFYQPQIDALTGEVVGMEALARWRHPQRGILSPDQFLSVATDLNVAADIDRMIFETAIKECQGAFGSMTRPPSLSFNVSAKRVYDDAFNSIRDHVESYSGKVAFELLETIFLEEESDLFLQQLDRLRELGIAIEVDDFGSGRASVVALQRIGPDRLKIDRRLVSQVAEHQSGLRLVRSIVEIGLALEMGVTAEGVETRQQAKVLAELGCDRLQGFYIAKPMAFEDLLGFLGNSTRKAKFG